MDSKIESVYHELIKHVTEKKLKEISVDVIDRYKAKDLNSLLRYADILDINASGMNISRLFSRVIQNYHPDKTASILNSIENSFEEGKLENLLSYKKKYIFEKTGEKLNQKKYDLDVEETYSYSDEYFGHEEEPVSRNNEQDDFDFEYTPDDEINPYDYGFIEAANRMFFGGLDYSITAEDLNNLEGDLDLSDSEIFDLKGVEHCRNITILNLSGNHIEKVERLSGLEMLESLYLSDNDIESIDSLAGLQNLKELDISFNMIEDISVLLNFNELLYVNLIGNPVKNKDVIKELEERGVIVII